MPKIKLTYFNPQMPAVNRGEAFRLVMAIGDVPFEDKRITPQEFRAMKAAGELPYGQIPILEVDRKMYSQSIAMLRYAGKLSGLYPADPAEALKVGEIMDSVQDYHNLFVPSVWERDAGKKKEMREALQAGPIPQHLSNLTKQLEANGGTGRFVGDALTVADMFAFRIALNLKSGIMDNVDGEGILATFPLIEKVYDVVRAHPKVIAYYAAHPQG